MGDSHFWQTVRKAAGAVSQVFNGPRQLTEPARESTPTQRALSTGTVMGWPTSNKWAELNHATSWNFVGIHAVAKQWALASVAAYDRAKQVNKSHAHDGPAETRTPLQNHWALKLLARPNPMMGRMEWMYLCATHLRLTHEIIIWEVRDQSTGLPSELWVLPRAWLTYQNPQERYPLGLWRVMNPRGMQAYWGDSPLAGGFYLDVRDTMVIKWPHPLYPGEGNSPLTACSRIVDIMEQTDLAVWASLLNAPRPGMILTTQPGTEMTPDKLEQIGATLRARKGGAHNAGEVLVLQGLDVNPNHTAVSDLDAVNVREQNAKFGLGIQGVPGIATGMRSEVGSYSGDAASFNSFIELGVQPDLDLFASGLTHRFQRYAGEDFELEISGKRIDDAQLKAADKDKYMTGYEKGIFTLNQVLKVFGEPPAKTPDGQPDPVGDERKAPAQQPGMPGADDGGFGLGLDDQQPDEADDFDLDLDLADDDGPGDKMPERQAASGLVNRIPSMNGNGVAH